MDVTNINRYLATCVFWALGVALALGGVAVSERQNLVSELTIKSDTLHRLASQRADQHDAHLTSLSAIFVAGGVERQDLLLDVAATIMRFYPRITSVNVVPFDPSEPIIETRPSLMPGEVDPRCRIGPPLYWGFANRGKCQDLPDHYLLVKRTPNSDAARHGLALVIDARALIATDDPFWETPSASLRLSTPDGQTAVVGQLSSGETGFSKPLGSVSQPLVFETSLTIGLI